MSFKESTRELFEVGDEGALFAGKTIHFPIPESTTILALTPRQLGLARKGLIKTMTVSGDSLIDVGIFDGDKVICQKVFSKKEISPKTVCIVYVPSMADCVGKLVRFLGRETLLKAGNRNIPDMYVETESVDIRGIIIGIQRSPDLHGRFDRNYDDFDDVPW